MPICRAATAADLAALWVLRTRAVRASCAAHYPAAVIETWCASAPPASFPVLVRLGGAMVAEEDGELAGFAVLDLASGEVDAAFVDPAHQGRGIALDLLQRLDVLAQECGLQRLFLSASLNAVAFYERAGFVRVRDEVYAHRSGIGIASVFMEKMLSPACDGGVLRAAVR
ncbi:putative acetyltransferase [Massilia sp. MP_M2]|uniref:GNAT family N-acetyltransferase n=1 Tax=Massilia sp. MP_M2 TaxID=3071713 RepID=UPI00319DE5D2